MLKQNLIQMFERYYVNPVCRAFEVDERFFGPVLTIFFFPVLPIFQMVADWGKTTRTFTGCWLRLMLIPVVGGAYMASIILIVRHLAGDL